VVCLSSIQTLKMTPRRSITRCHTVYSVRLRCGGYSLFQTLDDTCRIAVFDEFRDNNEWDGFNLSAQRVLFCCYVTKNFFRFSEIEKVKSVPACDDIAFPNEAISLNVPVKVTLWKNTERQREILIIGGSISLCTTSWVHGRPKLTYKKLLPSDYHKFKHLELGGLRGYPELNERLSLCRKFGQNVDPKKEIAFQRPLPPDFETYVDMIGALVSPSQFGY